jgi:hypothetical protein
MDGLVTGVREVREEANRAPDRARDGVGIRTDLRSGRIPGFLFREFRLDPGRGLCYLWLRERVKQEYI